MGNLEFPPRPEKGGSRIKESQEGIGQHRHQEIAQRLFHNPGLNFPKDQLQQGLAQKQAKGRQGDGYDKFRQ